MSTSDWLSLRQLWRAFVIWLEGPMDGPLSAPYGPNSKTPTFEKPTKPLTPLTRRRALRNRKQPAKSRRYPAATKRT